MFLKIPNLQILDFGMVQFAEHVLDTAPTITTRSQMRLVMKAVELIAGAKDGVAELPGDVAKEFASACEAAPIPPLVMQRHGASGKPFGEPVPVPKRAFEAFYEAVEGMTTERTGATPASDLAPDDSLPVAAE